LRSNATIMSAPHTTPMNHEMMIVFVILHHIVASFIMVCRCSTNPALDNASPASSRWQLRHDST
jgi:hypothetical protein